MKSEAVANKIKLEAKKIVDEHGQQNLQFWGMPFIQRFEEKTILPKHK